MTTELIQRFATDHGISKIRAMIVISELLGKEKRSTGMDRSKKLDNSILPYSGW